MRKMISVNESVIGNLFFENSVFNELVNQNLIKIKVSEWGFKYYYLDNKLLFVNVDGGYIVNTENLNYYLNFYLIDSLVKNDEIYMFVNDILYNVFK